MSYKISHQYLKKPRSINKEENANVTLYYNSDGAIIKKDKCLQ